MLERTHWSVGTNWVHRVGQPVCARIDERHRAILPPEIYGDGDPEGVRSRAAERMKDTARAAVQLGVTQVNGFTGSSIWHLIYSFPPNDYAAIERGYQEFAERWGPIMDVFDAEGVRFGLGVHPPARASDFVPTRKAPAPANTRAASGTTPDPSPPRPRGGRRARPVVGPRQRLGGPGAVVSRRRRRGDRGRCPPRQGSARLLAQHSGRLTLRPPSEVSL